jgi:hypothetical protein
LEVIKRCVLTHYESGRSHISRVICEELNWKQPNGWLKDRACRDVLLRLEEMEFVKLPPPLTTRKSNRRGREPEVGSYLARYNLASPITEFPAHIELEFAKGNHSEQVWNELVDRYHYLGHSVIVGRYIKYLIKANGDLLGGISFSSPAWHLDARDTILNAIGIYNPRDYTVNNSRFLILPHVQVANLASHVLSLATKKVVEDWSWYYSITPVIAETFVQPSLYEGTCYKAANWIEVGITKGYAKKGTSYRNSQEQKQIFLYGLDKNTRRKLRQVLSGGL